MILLDNLKKDVIKLRQKKDISMDIACKEIGVSKATLSRVEKGNTPDALTLFKVCDWLQINPTKYYKKS